MKEQSANQVADSLATRWPGRVQVQIIPPTRRGKEDGYSIRVTVLGANRIFRLARPAGLPSILMVCSVLLGEELPQQLVNGLTPDDRQKIRATYGPYVPRSQPGPHRRGQISIERLAQQYHVSRRKILEVLQSHE